MSRRFIFRVVALSLAVAACGGDRVTIDASSCDAFARSYGQELDRLNRQILAKDDDDFYRGEDLWEARLVVAREAKAKVNAANLTCDPEELLKDVERQVSSDVRSDAPPLMIRMEGALDWETYLGDVIRTDLYVVFGLVDGDGRLTSPSDQGPG